MVHMMKDRLDVRVPNNCTPHQCVKGGAVSRTDPDRRCVFCDAYVKSLNTVRCEECLDSESLIHFKADTMWLESLKRFNETHQKEE